MEETTASSLDVLSGKKFFGVGSDEVQTGAIPSKPAQTYTPTTSNIVIPAGQYLSEPQTIAGDADLIASNIKQGVNLFGVLGNLGGALKTSSGTQTINGSGSIVVNGLAFKPIIVTIQGGTRIDTPGENWGSSTIYGIWTEATGNGVKYQAPGFNTYHSNYFIDVLQSIMGFSTPIINVSFSANGLPTSSTFTWKAWGL